ncbi:prepilin-type N-terminal cleavage/methylation domain-containing protein [Lysinibacillus xylanilyticus]|uniref:prepilin-type N-terminal cleavage/methylation domain-containing protein n=1 Tax=Lysinibacillus xylanilyticus TaxID=582475 RepID=UPI003D04A23B
MFKKILNKKLLKNQKGLTLIELLAVIVILAIVAAIAIPAIGNIIENSRIKGMKADIANVISAANIYQTENNNDLPPSVQGLSDFLQTPGSVAGTSTFSLVGKEIAISGTATVNKKIYKLDKVKLSTLKTDEKDLENTGISLQ